MEKRIVTDNFIAQRYEMALEHATAYADYEKIPGAVILTHVCVPPAYEGQGIGGELVEGILQNIRSQGLQVVPRCTFAAHYIRRHPEWEDLVCKQGFCVRAK